MSRLCRNPRCRGPLSGRQTDWCCDACRAEASRLASDPRGVERVLSANTGTQEDRVLAALQLRGEEGLHTFEMRANFIGNPSQRIANLRDNGHTITATHERLHGRARGARYRLVSKATKQPSEPQSPPPDWRAARDALKGAPSFVGRSVSPYKPDPVLDDLWKRAYGGRRRRAA